MADDALEHARRRGRRYGTLVVLVVAVAFVLSSTYQIAVAVFSLPGSAPGAAPSRACADGVRSLAAALDRASAKASLEHDSAGIDAAFARELDPEWSGAAATERTCGADPAGAEAYAALLRLRRAHETLLHRRQDEVRPLRDGLELRLSPP